MKISVFGLGYVGVVSAACLAADGHDVIGVDPNATKVDLIDRGIAPIVEEDIEALIASSVAAGRLSASMSVADAIQTTELSLICVGTPSQLLYDKHVNLAALTGANKDYILNHIPHISRLMVDSVEKVTDFAETIVVGNKADEFRDVLGRLRDDQVVIDLARISGKTSDRQYQGICW